MSRIRRRVGVGVALSSALSSAVERARGARAVPSDVAFEPFPLGFAFAGGVFAAALAARTFSDAEVSCDALRRRQVVPLLERLILNSLGAAPLQLVGSLRCAARLRHLCGRPPLAVAAGARLGDELIELPDLGELLAPTIAVVFFFSSAAFFCAAACRELPWYRKKNPRRSRRAPCARRCTRSARELLAVERHLRDDAAVDHRRRHRHVAVGVLGTVLPAQHRSVARGAGCRAGRVVVDAVAVGVGGVDPASWPTPTGSRRTGAVVLVQVDQRRRRSSLTPSRRCCISRARPWSARIV